MASTANSIPAPTSQQDPAPRAVSAKRTQAPARRSVLMGIGSAIAGTAFGVTPQRADGFDLTGAAQGYIEDCRDLGMSFAVGPDGDVWFAMPVTGSREDFAARNRQTAKLDERPRLKQAVRDAVRRTV